MKTKIIGLFLLCFLSISNAFPQTRSNYINFETLTVESGLSQNFINCIFQDQAGIVWIGTEDGLSKYDGVKFLKYYKDVEATNSISGSQITGIVEDQNNFLWISTKKDGLNSLNPNRKIFTHFFNNPQSDNYLPNISNLKFDGKNTLFFTFDNTIYSFDIITKTLQNIDLKVSTAYHVSGFFIDENKLWVWSDNNVFLQHDIEKNITSEKYSLDEDVSITILHKKENKIIIGTNHEIIVYHLETHQYENIYKSIVIPQNQEFFFRKDLATYSFPALDICVGRDNTLFVSGRENLVSLRFDTDRWGNEQISSNYYEYDFAGNSIMADRSGNIWLGTNGKGVKIFNELLNQFKANYHFDDFQSLSSIRSIRSISENGDYLFVGGYYGLMFINKKSFEITNFAVEVRNNNPKGFYSPKDLHFDPAVYCLLPDPDKPDEILWVGVEGYSSGLYRYNLKTKKITHFAMNGDPDDFNANFLFDICDDKYGNLWLAGDYGAYKFDRNTEEFTYYQNDRSNPNSIQAGKITTIFKDSNDVLWFGSAKDGVSYFSEATQSFIHFRVNNSSNSLPSNSILSIHQDKNQNYWFGTLGSGLSKYDFEAQMFQNYTVSDGLPNNVIYGIQEDEEGNLWVSTNYGVSKFDINSEKFTNFSLDDGLINLEYNTGASFKSQDGIIFFGGLNGFDYFAPNKIVINEYQPPIVLTSVQINNVDIQADATLGGLKILELSSSDNVFSLEFAALSYFQSAKNRYAYKLEGIHTDWVYLGKVNTVSFNGLKSGRYILKLKASNNNGIWNEEAFELPVLVHPPFWRKLWFIASMFGVLLIVMALVFRFIKMQDLKRQKELESIIIERTFEIQIQKEELQLNADNLKKAFDMVNTLSKTKDDMSSMLVHDLKNPLNSIINYSRLIGTSEKVYRPELLEKTNEIEKSALDMLTLVNNLMDISRMEEAKMPLNLMENSLNKALDEAYLQTKYSLTEKNLTFENRVLQSLTAEFDYDLIVRVLMNLLSNAIKFSENNSKIIVDCEVMGEIVQINITDFGAGIPQEHIENVFNKFVQAEVRKLGITQSTGLGLAFSKLVVEAHQQQIGVVSKLGEGSTFWFTLPYLPSISQGTLVQADYTTQNVVLLSNREISDIQKQLKLLKFYQTGEIFSILSCSEFSSSEFLQWKKEVEKAVLYTNEEYYNELIKL